MTLDARAWTGNIVGTHKSGARRTVWYVDSVTGSDLANSGKSPTSPFATMAKANATCVAGDVIRTVDGSTLLESITPAQPRVCYDHYGSGVKPIWDGSQNVVGTASDWTSIGSNRWTRTVSLSQGSKRLAVDGGTAQLPQTSQGAVTATGNWFFTSNTLTLFSSGGNPASVFTTVRMGMLDCVIVTSIDGLWFNNLHVTWSGRFGFNLNSMTNGRFENVDVDFTGQIGNSVVSGSNITYVNCTATSNGISPQQNTSGWEIGEGTAGGDISGVKLYNCQSIGNAEDGIQVRSTSNNMVVQCYNCTFDQNFENAADGKDGDAEFYNCTFTSSGQSTDIPITLHISSFNWNLFDSVITGRTASNTNGSAFSTGTAGPTANLYRCKMIALGAGAAQLQAGTGNCTFTECVFIKTGVGTTAVIVDIAGGSHTFTNCTAAPTSAIAAIGLRVNAATAVATSTNCIWGAPTTSTGQYCVLVNVAGGLFNSTNDEFYKGETTVIVRGSSGGNRTQASVLAGIAGTGGITITGALVSDPLFTDPTTQNFIPQAASPVKGAGTRTGVNVDQAGNPMTVPPQIGALNAA